MLELFIDYYEPIKKILLYLLIILIIFSLLMKSRIKNYIINNREIMLKNPILVPLVSYFDDNNKQITIMGVIMEMIYNACKEMFDVLMKPYYMVLNGFVDLFKSINNSLNVVRKQIAVMRGMLFKSFEDMYRRIENTTGTMTFLFLKLREVMKKTYAMTTLMMYTVQHSFNFLDNIIKSPVGKLSKMLGDSGWFVATYALGVGGIPSWTSIDLCFSPNTVVVVDGNDKMIKDVNIGDKLYFDKVIAKIEAKYTGQDMFKINDTIVSGGHAIDIFGNGIRVKDYYGAKPHIDYSYDKLICLVTDTGYIQVKDGTVFRDYLDNHDRHAHALVKKMTKKFLNNTYTSISEDNIDLLSGIILDNNISILNTDDDILGVIDIGVDNIGMFKLKNMDDNTLYSGGMLIKYNDIWICIYEHPYAEYVEINKSIAKNWIVKDNIIRLSNGIYLRDMIEVGDTKFNEYVSKYLLL